ncbi:uncharacterized protein LOC129177385 [Dunckerocampus dactyliophorus]|uniref:uncharacterized protein LOC129177385 n=1 Tax=Dunckerocampus dactyliophorus TaxID=161453 RepID=UPI002404A16C|nr:uncharacterized protein LOC129177385 [Dunckerocampus dactyliophorus]
MSLNCSDMIHKANMTTVALCWAAALILTCVLMVDGYRLRKANRRHDDLEAKATGLRRGKIVFGNVLDGDSPVMDTKKSNTSVEDEMSYQADFPAQTQQPTSQEAFWRHMSSLHCAGDQMKLRVNSLGPSHLSVQQANGHPLPLSLVPSTCGYNMHWNSLGFLMYVPFGGCYMLQQGGSFVLPMLWQELPVSLWCPKPSLTTAAPKVTTALPSDPNGSDVQVPPTLPQTTNLPTWHKVQVLPRGLQNHKFPTEPQVQMLHPRSQFPLASVPQNHMLPFEPQVQIPPAGSQFPFPSVPKNPKFPSEPEIQILPPGSQVPFPSVPRNHIMPQFPGFPMGLPAPQNIYVPRQYLVPQVSQYPLLNPYAWQFPGHQPLSGKQTPSQKDPANPGMQSNIPYFPWPYPYYPAKPTTTPAQTTTAAPFQIPPELIPAYQELMAAMLAAS